MLTPSELLRSAPTYDVIIGDFGRDATIEYLRLASAYEKLLLAPVLASKQLPFYDEYRKSMYNVISDIAFLKSPAIRASADQLGHLTEDILVGLGPSGMSDDFVDRAASVVFREPHCSQTAWAHEL